MDSLLLEPICNSQDHIFMRGEDDNNCELCSKRFTDYKCKNCYRELCNRCHTYEIIRIRDKEMGITRSIPFEDIQEQDIQIHRNARRIIGRKITKSPPSGLKSVLGFFKSIK